MTIGWNLEWYEKAQATYEHQNQKLPPDKQFTSMTQWLLAETRPIIAWWTAAFAQKKKDGSVKEPISPRDVESQFKPGEVKLVFLVTDETYMKLRQTIAAVNWENTHRALLPTEKPRIFASVIEYFEGLLVDRVTANSIVHNDDIIREETEALAPEQLQANKEAEVENEKLLHSLHEQEVDDAKTQEQIREKRFKERSMGQQ